MIELGGHELQVALIGPGPWGMAAKFDHRHAAGRASILQKLLHGLAEAVEAGVGLGLPSRRSRCRRLPTRQARRCLLGRAGILGRHRSFIPGHTESGPEASCEEQYAGHRGHQSAL